LQSSRAMAITWSGPLKLFYQWSNQTVFEVKKTKLSAQGGISLVFSLTSPPLPPSPFV
jgi:hypothetical protein